MTNKTKFTAAALFSATILGLAFVGNNVHADGEGPSTTVAGTKTETGHAYATFERDTTGGQVKHPNDPGLSYTPDNSGDITHETGELTLDAIPSSLNFGTNTTTGASQTVKLLPSLGDTETPARSISDNGPATSDHGAASNDSTQAQDDKSKAKIFTQVTNLATNGVQWKLSATLGAFYKADTNADAHAQYTAVDADHVEAAKAANAIPGAYITLKNGASVHDETDATTNVESWQPAAQALAGDVQLNAFEEKTIVDSNAQRGVFQQQWNDSDVTLTAPTGAPVGKFAADIAWTLSSTPATDTSAPENTNPTQP